MPIVTTPCLILQTFRFGDTSKILRLLTRDHGPVSAMARGALRARSRMSGVLEPFVEGIVTLYLKPDRDLHTLSGFDLIRSRQALGSDMARFAGASVLSELVLRLAPSERDDRLYATLQGGLDALMSASSQEAPSVAAARIWQLVGVLGFEPSLEHCLSCGRRVGSVEGCYFDTRDGGIRCTRCPAVGYALDPDGLRTLRDLSGNRVPERLSGPQLLLLTEFIRVHVAEDIRIRSLDFLTGDHD
ncbi:MAG: DNA repair protein RecO [Gemmatimonadota bacterium]